MYNESWKEKELTQEQRQLLHSFPGLSAEELETVNNLYNHYIFYETKPGGRRLHTSCCHKQGVFFPDAHRVETDAERILAASAHNDGVICPYCGKAATLKNIGKSKRCELIRQDKEVIFLHCVNGEVYAQAYWTRKTYFPESYSQEPHYSLSIAYHFKPGRATMFYIGYGDWHCVEQTLPLRGRPKICEPFSTGGMFSAYLPYKVIGMDCLEESCLRYCCSGLKSGPNGSNNSLMKFLTVCCLYPKKVEMLMKSGMGDAVQDLMRGKKNAAVLKWDEPDVLKSFGLNKLELREALKIGSLEVIGAYKKLKKSGFKTSMTDVGNICSQLRYNAFDSKVFIGYAVKYKIAPERLMRYLDKFTGGCHVGGHRSAGDIFRHWKDYIDAAEAIGYDMENPVVLCPKQLQERHDEATGEHRRRLELEKSKEKKRAAAALKKELLERNERYRFEYGEYFIRIAMSCDEIIAEGKALSHCVAGYGGRHEKGALTICFLRKTSAPNVPLATIEMHGKDMQQVHGYRNENEACPENPDKIPARRLYAEILDPWLKWVKAGSKRDKAGNPRIPTPRKKKKENEAA